MSKYVIEKGFPIPETKSHKTSIAVLRTMDVGDSFFLDGEAHNSPAIYAWRAQASKSAIKISIRKEGNGMRLWRVA